MEGRYVYVYRENTQVTSNAILITPFAYFSSCGIEVGIIGVYMFLKVIYYTNPISCECNIPNPHVYTLNGMIYK